jgi:hypothetical protein
MAVPLLLIGALSQSPKTAPKTAIDQLGELQARAVNAVKSGDQQARIAADMELFHLLNGSPTVVEALARAYAASGDPQRAIASLNQFADLGQSAPNLLNGQDQRLSAIQSLPEYKKVLERFTKNEIPISLGTTAITFADPGLLAEDIDFDSTSRTFLVTSVLEHKIVHATLDGTVSDFAASPDQWPMVAIKVDAPRHRVWATEVAFDGFTTAPKDAWGRSAVLCFDARTGKLLLRIEGPAHSALGDMVLTRDGDPIVSDGDGGKLYRVSNGALNEIDSVDFISPQTPALSPDAGKILVPDYVRGVAVFNLETSRASWMNQDGADHVALNGIDGVYVYHHALILTQNGTSPQRVILLQLDTSLTRITGTKVIEQASPDFGDPTHGVIVGDDFYYIANSGWAQLDDHGDVKPGSKLTSPHIIRYSLR